MLFCGPEQQEAIRYWREATCNLSSVRWLDYTHASLLSRVNISAPSLWLVKSGDDSAKSSCLVRIYRTNISTTSSLKTVLGTGLAVQTGHVNFSRLKTRGKCALNHQYSAINWGRKVCSKYNTNKRMACWRRGVKTNERMRRGGGLCCLYLDRKDARHIILGFSETLVYTDNLQCNKWFNYHKRRFVLE
jgi:hypothetical protein